MNIYKYFNRPTKLTGYTIAFVTVPELAYDYARETNNPFPEGEKAIASDLHYAYYYAKDVLKKRFPEGEKAIAVNPDYAYLYAVDVIKGRFPEGEDTINSSYYNTKYKEFLNSL